MVVVTETYCVLFEMWTEEVVFVGKPVNTLWTHFPHKKEKKATICCSYTEIVGCVAVCNMDRNILNPHIFIVLETIPKFKI